MPDPVSDAAIMAALGRQLTRSVQKQAAAAGNLANLDTPGYRTQEVRFAEALDASLESPDGLQATDSRHFGAGAQAEQAELIDTPNLASRRDGNNVQLDRELLKLTRAGGEFSAAQTMLAAKFRLVRYAINEGR